MSSNDELRLIDIVSFIISGYGVLLFTFTDVPYPFPRGTRLIMGFALFLIGWALLVQKYCFRR